MAADLHPAIILFFAAGLLVCWLTPISAWWMLAGQPNRNARVWFAGTALYACVATLFVLGGALPPWLRGPLVGFLSLASVLCMMEALRREVSSAPPPYLAYVAVLAGEQVLLIGTAASGAFVPYGLVSHLVVITAADLGLILLAHRARRTHRSRALWLVQCVVGLFILSNISRVVEFGLTGRVTTLMDFNLLANLGLILNYISVTFYCYGYWGFVIEKNRASLQQAHAATVRARENENIARQREELAQEVLQHRTEMMERAAVVGKIAQSAALTGSIAHEINQPLAAVQLNVAEARRLSEGSPAPAPLKDLLAQIEHDNARIAAIVKRIVTIFQKSASPTGLHSLDNTVRKALELLRQKLETGQIRTQSVLDASSPFQFAAGEVEHILLNLLNNAVEAMQDTPPAERRILIETWHDNETVYLAISDNGRGIPAELRASIFELRETRKSNGMGLGLWLARYIAERNGGRLILDDDDSRGTRFVLQLPRKPLTALDNQP